MLEKAIDRHQALQRERAETRTADRRRLIADLGTGGSGTINGTVIDRRQPPKSSGGGGFGAGSTGTPTTSLTGVADLRSGGAIDGTAGSARTLGIGTSRTPKAKRPPVVRVEPGNSVKARTSGTAGLGVGQDPTAGLGLETLPLDPPAAYLDEGGVVDYGVVYEHSDAYACADPCWDPCAPTYCSPSGGWYGGWGWGGGWGYGWGGGWSIGIGWSSWSGLSVGFGWGGGWGYGGCDPWYRWNSWYPWRSSWCYDGCYAVPCSSSWAWSSCWRPVSVVSWYPATRIVAVPVVYEDAWYPESSDAAVAWQDELGGAAVLIDATHYGEASAPLLPDPVEGWQRLEAGRDQAALDLFADLLTVIPYEGEARVGYAVAQGLLGREQTAIEMMREAISIDAVAIERVAPTPELRLRLLELRRTYDDRLARAYDDVDALFMVAALRYLAGDVSVAWFAADAAIRLGDDSEAALALRDAIAATQQ